MSLNSVKLSSQNVVDLYKNQLLETSLAIKQIEPQKEDIVIAKPKQAKPFAFLGKNLMNFVVVVNYPDEVYLPEEQLNFISNILKACKMNIGDIAIVNLHRQPASLKLIAEKLAPKQMVLFNIDPSLLEIKKEFTHFNTLTINDIQIFNTPPLEQLNQNTEEGKLLKSKLWLCMKKILNLS